MRCHPRLAPFRVLLALFALAAAPSPALLAQAADTHVWQYSTPEEQGVDSAQLARLFALLTRESVPIHSFVLIRHDRIVAESYFYPYTATARHTMYSVSKSFTSSLVGIAIDRGLISGVDERVLDVFRGVSSRPTGGNMERMRLRHLLSMATGHATDTTNRITYTGNWERAFMELPVEAEPGSSFVYNSGASYMLAVAVQRRAGVSAAEFARQNLFGPLGITDYGWDTSPSGVICGGWGLSLRPLDMARFGLMYLHGGVWNGQQVVPRTWVEEASRKQADNGTSGFWGSGYGYQFWLNDFGGYRADGAFGQYIFILPEHDLVAVFTNQMTSDTERPGRYLREYILPTLSREPLPANPRANALLARAAAAAVALPGTAGAPLFTQLPESRTVAAGSEVTFTVAAAGSPAPECQWYKDELPIGGARSLALTLPAVTTADAGEYVAVLRNASGASASYPATLAVLSPPTLVVAPDSMVAADGGEAELAVVATGEDLQYEWRRDGAVVASATGPVLRIRGATAADAGEYTVRVSNPRGEVTSPPARLRVGTRETRARLMNISARAAAGTGNRTLIVGTVVDGADRTVGLPVLFRAVGPTLAALNVQGPVADPALILYTRTTPIASNSDWRGGAFLGELMDRAGAFALSPRSADASLRRVLRPRDYTMHVVSSLPDRSGVALAEIYDASGGVARGGPRLANLSARAFAGVEHETLIGGFVIEGAGTLRLLIRAVGPTLASQGVGDILADPQLTLFRRETAIGSNDNWAGQAALRTAFQQVGAFELPGDSADAALLVDLPAGVYSAHVTGKNRTTGVALFELYVMPDAN